MDIKGFYGNVFYPINSPLYDPIPIDYIYGTCFVDEVATENFRGLLLDDSELRDDYFLHD